MTLHWRSPLRVWWDGSYADWLVAIDGARDESLYLIRDAETKRVLHAGGPSTDVFGDLDRHMFGWKADGALAFSPGRIEIALIAASAQQEAA